MIDYKKWIKWLIKLVNIYQWINLKQKKNQIEILKDLNKKEYLKRNLLLI